MANLIAEITPAEFDFQLFEGDDFLWERVLKEVDKLGNETAIPLDGYEAEFEVVDSEGASVFMLNSLSGGYPANDGIVLGTLDGSVVIYQQDLPTPGDHTYAFRMMVPDTLGSTNTICYGKFVILEKIVTT